MDCTRINCLPEGQESVTLQIDGKDIDNERATVFEPQRGEGSDGGDSSVFPTISTAAAPEKKLTLFALRLAVLEKTATGLGTLGFIWATVVLLGGFAITLDKTDFWSITVILLIEGARIFSRSHELEWQHQATWSLTGGMNSFRALRRSSHRLVDSLKSICSPISTARDQCRLRRKNEEDMVARSAGNRCPKRMLTRTWEDSDVPLLPFDRWVFISRNVSKILYWLQLVSAVACVVLSLMKLVMHNYGNIAKGDTDKRNRKAALNIFYSLALAEALLCLLEKAYWEYTIVHCGLLEKVNKECELGLRGIVSVKRFFYDAYSKCVNGSIFDGLKMDMVSFGMELLASSSPDEQLIGARILRQFAMNEKFSDDTLQKIGTTSFVIERLVEMLNWEDTQEVEIRKAAADILSKLSGKRQNSLRVTGIPGAMESISSLLKNNRASGGAVDEISEKKIISDHASYGFSTFNNLGLLILKNLARNHDNCGKIGSTRGLLPKIIEYTHAEENLLKDKKVVAEYENVTPPEIVTVRRSLKVVKMLASTSGATGKQLRKEITEIVFTISNIRDILQHGEKHPELQELGIEILTSLAFEEDATERIGGTGGVLKELFNIFFSDEIDEKHNYVRSAAGEALAMLAHESKNNCHRILKLRVLEKLVAALKTPVLRVNAARILRNLCTYTRSERFNHLKDVTSAAPMVLMAIMSEENKPQEVMIGLAAQVFKFMTPQESALMFERVGIKEAELASAVIQILKKYKYPTVEVPKIRRFAIELSIWMMKDKETNVRLFEDLGLEEVLTDILETTAEIESFHMFSGIVGLSRHNTSMHSLVETALGLLADR